MGKEELQRRILGFVLFLHRGAFTDGQAKLIPLSAGTNLVNLVNPVVTFGRSSKNDISLGAPGSPFHSQHK